MKIGLTFTCLFCMLLGFSSKAQQCYADQTNLYWFIDQVYGSNKVANCNPNYNCYGFIRSYLENGCTPSSGVFYNPYTCLEVQGNKGTEWRSNGQYIRVCNETLANLAYYDVSGWGGHAAVKSSTIGGVTKYISKYGSDGPLVSHNLNGSWYHLAGNQNRVTSTEFWAYIGSNPIQGNATVVGTGSQNYTINNLAGYTFSWSMLSGGDRIYISSQSGNTATLSPLCSGSAILQVTISSGCGSVSQQLVLTVQTNICLEGSFTIPNAANKILMNSNNVTPPSWVNVNVTCPNASTYTWQRTSGSISFYNSGAFASFTLTSGSSISFLVTAKNSSNTTLGTRNISFYNYGSFRAFSNPASTSLKLDVAEDILFAVTLQGLKSKSLKEVKNYHSKTGIDVSDLEDGDYVLKIYHEGKLVNEQRVKVLH